MLVLGSRFDFSFVKRLLDRVSSDADLAQKILVLVSELFLLNKDAFDLVHVFLPLLSQDLDSLV